MVFLLRVLLPRLAEPIPRMADSAWAWPLAGIPVGLLAWTLHAGAIALGLPPLCAALLALGGGLAITGGLHADGLADCADGFWGGHERARRLEIMRDSRTGAYGVMALVIALGLQASAIAETAPRLWAFLGIAVASRAAMAALAALPPAREDGLGRGAAGPGAGRIAAALAIGLLALLLGGAGIGDFAALALSALALAAVARAKIGGQTGDVLGAGQVLAETALWLALAAR